MNTKHIINSYRASISAPPAFDCPPYELFWKELVWNMMIFTQEHRNRPCIYVICFCFLPTGTLFWTRVLSSVVLSLYFQFIHFFSLDPIRGKLVIQQFRGFKSCTCTFSYNNISMGRFKDWSKWRWLSFERVSASLDPHTKRKKNWTLNNSLAIFFNTFNHQR